MNETIFEEGQTLGPYRIVRCIGCGGMGEVYEVEHEGLGVRYALKAFAYSGKSGLMLRAKFMEEGQVLARLRHPNLVRVFDLTVDGATGVAYYVMDLVRYKDGNAYSLADVDRTSAGEDQIYLWCRDVCNALDYIHSKGVVHRDVKLNNILLNIDKHAILSDFGVAHIFGDGMVKSASGAHATGAFNALDGRNVVLGTDIYKAPEVVAGAEATQAADTYSLGVAMFKLLTGVWHEPGADVRALLSGRTWKYRWADVLPGMLATAPEDRPQILAQAVIGLLPDDMRVSEGGKGRKRLRLARIAVTSVCVALVAGFGLMAWKAHEATAREAMAREELARNRAEVERLRQENEKLRVKVEELADKVKVEDKADRAERQTEEVAAAAPAVGMPEEARSETVPQAKEVEAAAETPKKPESPAREYRWRDGSGKPLEVLFDIGGGMARLVPLDAAGSAFWMSRMPVTVAAWRAVKGGHDGLEALEAALPPEYPLCVLRDKAEVEDFCRAMTERFRASLPDGHEVRLATEEEMRAALADEETAKQCEATGRSAEDCVGTGGAVARARFRRVRTDCGLDRFGGWSEDGTLAGRPVAVAGLSMPRASGIVSLCRDGTGASLRHLVVGRKKSD